MKILYFEGAGCTGTQRNDVENCRIRTAFVNDNDQKIYIELTSCEIDKYNKKRFPQIVGAVGFVDHCFYITGDYDDCNKQRISEIEKNTVIEYTKENILKLINNKLNCSFKNVIILPNLAGYRVHNDKNGYSLINDFVYDKKITAQREKIKNYFYDFEKNTLGKQYPNFSCWVNNNGGLSITIPYNCYNDNFNIDDVYSYNFDYKMPDDEILRKARAQHGIYSNNKTVSGKI